MNNYAIGDVMSKDMQRMEEEINISKGKSRVVLLKYYEIIKKIRSYPEYRGIRNVLLSSLSEVNYKLKHLNDKKFAEVFGKNLKSYDSNLYLGYKKMGAAPYVFVDKYFLKKIEDIHKKYENLVEKLENLRKRAKRTADNLVDIKDKKLRKIEECWFRLEEGDYVFHIMGYTKDSTVEDYWSKEFENEYRKIFGEEKLKNMQKLVNEPDKASQKLTDDEISFLLSYPTVYADLALLYLLENDIYDDEYYVKSIYQTANPYDYPMERALDYIERYYDRGRDIMDKMMMEKGFLHLDLTSFYVEHGGRNKFRDRLLVLLNSEKEPLLFYGAWLAYHYVKDKEILDRMLELANEMVEGKKDKIISIELINEFVYSLKTHLGMENEIEIRIDI